MKIKTPTALAMFLLTILPAASVLADFADVPVEERYKGGIEFLVSEGIINGYPDGTFKPVNTLNRAEMLKIIAAGAGRYFNWPSDLFDAYKNKRCFNDVPTTVWYTKYVCYGKDKGWIEGYENGKLFKPAQPVTFSESLKITLQAFGIAYADESEIWYRPIVRRASKDNLIPFDIKEFHADLKRNQMADMIARIIKFKKGNLEEYLGPRADLNVTYESIESGIDLTNMDVVELIP
ncbi:S-layer homology domain-containing protein [Candidatus Peregrinibacteria bacterium]|nr:S-layer homology domain-containing protein [Candidatus Peregrinibacteria bacterium]